MKLGVREICEVVFRAKTAQKIGTKVFYKNEPVIYFDSLKTSSLEGQSTTVYATGGRGNARLMGWDGERTVTFTMEDALISPEGMAILMGAGLVQGSEQDVIVHTTERVEVFVPNDENSFSVAVSQLPYIPNMTPGTNNWTLTAPVDAEDYIYIMAVQGDEIMSEPFVPSELKIEVGKNAKGQNVDGLYRITCYKEEGAETTGSSISDTIKNEKKTGIQVRKNDISIFTDNKNSVTALVDYYVAYKSDDAFEVTIKPDQFGCNFYVEASTLFRDTNGVDLPAEFIIPNAKVQSNFTFTMASTGDPSTFTFTMDAFPDYTRWDKKHKVIAALQVVKLSDTLDELNRLGTPHNNADVKTDYEQYHQGYIEY